jgi:hypothetical protein
MTDERKALWLQTELSQWDTEGGAGPYGPQDGSYRAPEDAPCASTASKQGSASILRRFKKAHRITGSVS